MPSQATRATLAPRRRLPLAFLLAAALPSLAPAAARAGVPSIRIRATRPAVLNNGRDVTEIIAEVRDSGGGFAANGTQVQFNTTRGTFRPSSTPAATVGTQSGEARVQLVGQEKGTASIRASVPGAVSDPVEVVFTDDPSETFQGNAFADVLATGRLVYSANDRVIEAAGPPQAPGSKGLSGASLTFRNIEIEADTLQVDCSANVVRAVGHVRVRRGGKRLECMRLYMPLLRGDGFAVIETPKRLEPVKVKTLTLETTPVTGGVPAPYFQLADLADAQQVITARKIRLFPGDKLQFNRPQFYTDGQKLVSMPYYSVPLYSTELFTDQFVSIGSQGLGVDLPYYYDMSATSTGIFHLRHGERVGRSAFSTQNGWSLDMIQDYNSLGINSRYTGQFGFTGITRSDWGFQWTHSQEFSPETRGAFSLDLPQHRSIFGSANLTRQFSQFQMGFNLSANHSLTGFKTSGTEGDVYIESNARKVGRTGYMMAVGTTATMGETMAAGFHNNVATEGIQARFFSSPFRLDRSTTLTNYVTVGHMWTSQGRSGASVISSLAASHTFGGGANLQMTYDFTKTPALISGVGSHRLSANLVMSRGNKWNLYMYGSSMLDAVNATVLADFNYAIAPRWRLALNGTFQRFSTTQYRDYSLGIARSIGGRDIVVSYSTFNHRFFFDIEASRF